MASRMCHFSTRASTKTSSMPRANGAADVRPPLAEQRDWRIAGPVGDFGAPPVPIYRAGATHPHVRASTRRALPADGWSALPTTRVLPSMLCSLIASSSSRAHALLGAADIYITPYLNPDQIVWARWPTRLVLAAGISTPYWYAEVSLAGRARDAGAVCRSGSDRRSGDRAA